MTKNKKTHTVVLRLAAVLLILVMLSTGMTAGRFARYATTASGSDSARVAVMAMNTSYDLSSQIQLAAGETKEFTVTLTNKDGNRVCEVAQDYSLSVVNLTGNMALVYEYYLVDGEKLTQVEKVTGRFDAGKETSVTYRIKIIWNGPQPAGSAFEVDALKLVIQAQQVD